MFGTTPGAQTTPAPPATTAIADTTQSIADTTQSIVQGGNFKVDARLAAVTPGQLAGAGAGVAGVVVLLGGFVALLVMTNLRVSERVSGGVGEWGSEWVKSS